MYKPDLLVHNKKINEINLIEIVITNLDLLSQVENEIIINDLFMLGLPSIAGSNTRAQTRLEPLNTRLFPGINLQTYTRQYLSALVQLVENEKSRKYGLAANELSSMHKCEAKIYVMTWKRGANKIPQKAL